MDFHRLLPVARQVAKPSAAPDCNGVSSNKAAMAIAILWLQGIREDALKALFDQFIILQLTKNLEEKILAIVALRSFISGPDMWSLSEGLELDASMNEEVISLLNVKDRVISLSSTRQMATFELYRRSTIGMCLTDTLDEMVSTGKLGPEHVS
ncbi:transcription initiation factor IIA subunit 2 [Tanacetum coccineum]